MGQQTSNVLFYLIPFLYAVAGLSFATITQQIEKDWLVVLSAGNEEWLRTTNAMMSQIDLACKTLAPAVTGLLFSGSSQSTVSITLMLLNAGVTMSFYIFMLELYYTFPTLATRANIDDSNIENNDENDDSNDNNVDDNEKITLFSLEFNPSGGIGGVLSALKNFSTSGCAGLMIAYAFLYMTVLSFGSLMIVYMRWAGMSDHWVGVSRGLAALTEFTGAALFPFFSKKFGDWQTGYFAIWYQFSLVFIASSSFFWANVHVSVIIIVVAVLLSRAGLWMFDLVARQIAQITIKEKTRGQVNGQWRSLIAFFDMSAYVVAVIFSSPDQFWVLTSLSAFMVGSAAVLYSATIPSNEEIPFRMPFSIYGLKFNSVNYEKIAES